MIVTYPDNTTTFLDEFPVADLPKGRNVRLVIFGEREGIEVIGYVARAQPHRVEIVGDPVAYSKSDVMDLNLL